MAERVGGDMCILLCMSDCDHWNMSVGYEYVCAPRRLMVKWSDECSLMRGLVHMFSAVLVSGVQVM